MKNTKLVHLFCYAGGIAKHSSSNLDPPSSDSSGTTTPLAEQERQLKLPLVLRVAPENRCRLCAGEVVAVDKEAAGPRAAVVVPRLGDTSQGAFLAVVWSEPAIFWSTRSEK